MSIKPKVNKQAAASATTTLIHALIAAAIVGLGTGLLDVVDTGTVSWKAGVLTVASAVVTSVVAYLHHSFGDYLGGSSN